MAREDVIRPIQFFLMFLSVAEPEEIQKYLEQLGKHREDIEDQLMDIVYFMPGIDWNSAWGLSSRLRNKIVKYIIKNKKAESGDTTQEM